MDPPPIVLSCRVTVFNRCAQGHRTQICCHSLLTVNYIEGNYGHPQTIIVYDEHRVEQLKILVVTEAAKYKIVDQFNHEILRFEDSTIILVFYHHDADDVRKFTDRMVSVFQKLHRFKYIEQPMDLSPPGSDDDDPHNGAAAAPVPVMAQRRAARPASPIVTWDCANCHFENTDEHSWSCGECNRPRVINWNLEWQCRCSRVYDTSRISECSQCRMWRCQRCTFQNRSTSLQCHSCHPHYRRR